MKSNVLTFERANAPTLVVATNLYKYFGHVHAVDDVSLQIQSGEIYGLVGSDGAGKTTTMRLLVGALLPDQGEISVCGFDVRRQVEQARSTIGYLSQRFSMYEDLTVLENIRFFAEIRGLSSTEWLPCYPITPFCGVSSAIWEPKWPTISRTRSFVRSWKCACRKATGGGPASWLVLRWRPFATAGPWL